MQKTIIAFFILLLPFFPELILQEIVLSSFSFFSDVNGRWGHVNLLNKRNLLKLLRRLKIHFLRPQPSGEKGSGLMD
jgi:hypothetical protein